MQFKELTVTLKGPLWDIKEFEIEATDVLARWEEINGEEGCVKVKDFEVSDDDVLNVYIYLGAPNHTQYTVVVKGEYRVGGLTQEVEFSEDFEVLKNGKLRIQIDKAISELNPA